MNLSLRTLTLVAALLIAASHLFAAETGNARIYVKGEDGAYMEKVPVYLYDGEKMYVVETSFLGAVSVDLKPGRYNVSAATTQAFIDGNLRLASSEGRLQIETQDTASLILTLHPVETRIDDLSQATLQKMGVADEVAKYTN